MMRRFMTRSSVLLTALLSVGACKFSVPDRGDTNYIVGLRIMDLKADPAEVAAGQMTTLSALVDDTMGRPIDIDWSYCDAVAPMGSDLNDSCVTSDSGPNIHELGNGPSLMITLPTVDPTVLGDPDQTDGVYLPVRAKVTAGTDIAKSIFRLRVNMGGTANQNPTLSGVYQVMAGAGTPTDGGTVMDGGTISDGTDLLTPIDPANPPVVHSGDKLTLRALFATGSAESYMVAGRPNDTGMATMRSTTERLDVSWYTTAGTISDAMGTGMGMGNGDMGMGGFMGNTIRDQVLTIDNNLPASGGTIDIWVVGRDNRGGSDYQHRTLVFQ